MSLKIFTRKKKIVNEPNKIDQSETEKLKDQLDSKKIDKLDDMINILKEISESIKINNSVISSKNIYENIVETKDQSVISTNSTFIPSINIEESSGISDFKKDVKKRNLSKTINKLKEI